MVTETKASTLILGGGIGGMATALGLARQGIRSHVLEQAPQLREVGAGLQLGPNGLRALDHLGVLDHLFKTAVFPQHQVLLDVQTGKIIKVLDMGAKFSTRYGYPYILAHRHDLLDALAKACEDSGLVTVQTSKAVTHVIDRENSAEVQCADGSHYVCNALIAADGLRSVVRKEIFVDDPLRPTPYAAFRGTLPAAEIVPQTGKDDLLIWAGSDSHLVQYPLRGGELYNQVAVLRTDHGFDTEDDRQAASAELDTRFSTAHPSVRAGVRKINRGARWTLWDRDPIVVWTKHRIALLGDAAHPMLQFMAQGACQALEDAVCLSWRLGQTPDNIERAFTLYQNTRVLRATRVQLTTRFMDRLWHPSGTDSTLRDEFLSKLAPTDYELFDWLYGDKTFVEGTHVA
ncbi:MAG: xlnD [Ramlibacter sp.]|nr:xlnD [Ramlibacter sp.]